LVADITASSQSGSPAEQLEKWLIHTEGKSFVVDKSDPKSICKATLGAAVHSAKKDVYIHKMMALNSDYQTSLMMLIDEFNKDMERGEAAQLRSIMKRLERENAILKESSKEPSSVGGNAVLQAQTSSNESSEEIQRLKDKIKELERKGKDSAMYMDEMEREFGENATRMEVETKAAQERIVRLEEEIRAKADDLDLAREKSVQLSKAEAKLLRMTERLEQVNVLKNQVRELQEENATIVGKRLEDEVEAKQLDTLKQQIETYKNKAFDFESRLVQSGDDLKQQEEKFEELSRKYKIAMDREKFAREKLQAADDEIERLSAEVEVGSAHPAEASSRVVDKQERERELEDEVRSLQELLESNRMSSREGQMAGNKELIQQLKDKESECLQLHRDKEKLQEYVKVALQNTQARTSTAIKSLNADNEAKDSALRNSKQLLKDNEERYQREQRLIMSSFYEIGLDMQRRYAFPSNNSTGSWLAKHRKEKF